MSEDIHANKAQSTRLYEEVFGRGNYEVADGILTADIVTHGPGSRLTRLGSTVSSTVESLNPG